VWGDDDLSYEESEEGSKDEKNGNFSDGLDIDMEFDSDDENSSEGNSQGAATQRRERRQPT